jgi:RimJ/RimL family protein N-acetyltransferase
MMRSLNIFRSQLRGMSIRGFVDVLRQALFRNDPILIYARELQRLDSVAIGPSEDVEIRKGALFDLQELPERFYPLPWEFQCHHFDGVQDFFVACGGEGIQHISWVYYRNDPNRILSLGDREAEIKYCLTLPHYRGRGLYPRALIMIARFLASRGFSRVFVCVHQDNSASIRGIEKAGFERVASLRLRKILGVQVSKRLVTGAL